MQQYENNMRIGTANGHLLQQILFYIIAMDDVNY